MLQLLFLFLIPIGVYALLSALHGARPGWFSSRAERGRIGAAALFVVTGASHFVMPAELAELLPPWLPLRMELVAVTGILEILGAIGLLIPQLAFVSAVALMLFLVGVLPANIYGALTAAPVGAHALGPIYLLARVPFQLFVIGWLYTFGVRGESRRAPHARRKHG